MWRVSWQPHEPNFPIWSSSNVLHSPTGMFWLPDSCPLSSPLLLLDAVCLSHHPFRGFTGLKIIVFIPGLRKMEITISTCIAYTSYVLLHNGPLNLIGLFTWSQPGLLRLCHPATAEHARGPSSKLTSPSMRKAGEAVGREAKNITLGNSFPMAIWGPWSGSFPPTNLKYPSTSSLSSNTKHMVERLALEVVTNLCF